MYFGLLMLFVTTQKQYQDETAVRAYISINHFIQKYTPEGSTTSYLGRSLDTVFRFIMLQSMLKRNIENYK